MCRIEERIYVGADGHRSKFEEAFTCDKSRGGRLCSKVKRRTTEYYPKNGTLPRESTPSPITPPTPTGSGTYLIQQRRPSGTSVRPSTRDGQKAIKPEIIIEFGSKKGKGSKYPSVSVSTGTYKRSSMGDSSVGSNDIAIDSADSDESHPIRTGFPDAPLPTPVAFGQGDGFIPTPNVPRSHHRQTSSASSFTGSSRTPSLYVTSDPDYDSPTSQRTARYPSTIIHNPPPAAAPPSPSRKPTTTSSSHRTVVVTPQGFTQDTHTPDGLFPLDYPEFADRSSSSHASSGAPEITRRGKDRDRDERRKKKEEERKRQEEQDRKIAEELAKQENVKQVRFELGRAEARAIERAERTYADKEKTRAEEREEARRRKDEERKKVEREELAAAQEKAAREQAAREQAARDQAARDQAAAAKERKKEKKGPPPSMENGKRPNHTRRLSMTQAQVDEQRRLLAAEGLHMQGEREAAEARERDERNAVFRQQQEQPGYYDPRGGDRTLSNANTGTVARRPSVSRRNSINNGPPMALGRSNSTRRTSIIQPNPPAITSQPQARLPSARQSGPPVSFPTNFNQDYSVRPPSARRPSYAQENPFAAPPTRGSGSSIDNPFTPAPSVLSPTAANAPDPWDVRVIQDTLPSARQLPVENRVTTMTMQQRGEAVINRASAAAQHAPRQAPRAHGPVAGYEDDYGDSESEEDAAPAYVPRSGLAKGKKKKSKY